MPPLLCTMSSLGRQGNGCMRLRIDINWMHELLKKIQQSFSHYKEAFSIFGIWDRRTMCKRQRCCDRTVLGAAG